MDVEKSPGNNAETEKQVTAKNEHTKESKHHLYISSSPSYSSRFFSPGSILMQTIMDHPFRRRLSLLFCLLLFFDHRAHSICVPRNSSHESISSSPKLSFPDSSPPAVLEMISTNITATATTSSQQQSSPKGDTNEKSTDTDGGNTPPPPVQTLTTTTKSVTDTVQSPTTTTTTTKSPAEPTDSSDSPTPTPPTTTEPTDSPDSSTPTTTTTSDSLSQPTDSPNSPTPTEPSDSPDSPHSPTPTTTTTTATDSLSQPTDSSNSPTPTEPTEPSDSPDSPHSLTPTEPSDSPDSPMATTDSPDSPTPTTPSSSIVNLKDSFGTKQTITSLFEPHSVLFPSITNLVKPDPAVEKICAKTDYPDLCRASISPFFNGKSDVMSILEISIKACAQYAKVAIAAAKQIINSRVTPAATASILDDCTGMFTDALDNLQNAMNAMAKRDVATINIMLSAAVSDFVTCEDEFEGQRSLLSSYNTKLSNMVANCLAVSSMIKI